jgi:hypothetical protein
LLARTLTQLRAGLAGVLAPSDEDLA